MKFHVPNSCERRARLVRWRQQIQTTFSSIELFNSNEVDVSRLAELNGKLFDRSGLDYSPRPVETSIELLPDRVVPILKPWVRVMYGNWRGKILPEATKPLAVERWQAETSPARFWS